MNATDLHLLNLVHHPWKCRVHLNTNQTGITTTGSVNFDTVDLDPNGNFTTGAGAKYTAPVAGFYLLTGGLSSSTSGTAGTYAYGVTIDKNGVADTNGDFYTYGFNGQTWGHSVATILQLDPGDTAQMFIQVNSLPGGGTIQINGSGLTYMSLHFLSPA